MPAMLVFFVVMAAIVVAAEPNRVSAIIAAWLTLALLRSRQRLIQVVDNRFPQVVVTCRLRDSIGSLSRVGCRTKRGQDVSVAGRFSTRSEFRVVTGD